MNYSQIANCEMLVMVAIFVAILFGFNVRYWRSRMINHLSVMYILLFLACFLELTAFVVDGHKELTWLNYLSNISYMAAIGTISHQTMEYANLHAPIKFWTTKRAHFLWSLPLFIELAALVTTPWTHYLYYIDETGTYNRDPSFIVQTIPFFYLIATMVVGIINYRRAQTLKERSFYMALAFFAVPPFLLGGLQLLIPWNALDLMMFSIALSLLLNYAVSQNNRITRDTLTKLPNREVMDMVLLEKIKDEEKGDIADGKHLYLLLGDLDDFKGINDNLGHVEGDKALILAADVLYQTAVQYKATAARFGGDEFVIILEAEDEYTAQSLIQQVTRLLAEASNKEAFDLKMSLGYTTYQEGDTIQDLLKRADNELYKVKKAKRVGR